MIDLKELIGYWNYSLPEKVDYADLVCAPAFAYGYKKVYADEYGYMVEDTIKALEELQAHKADDWIPVCERLPDEKTNPITKDYYDYQCTFKSGSVIDVRHYKFGNGHWWNGPEIVDEYITAWRPLPEPYREGIE